MKMFMKMVAMSLIAALMLQILPANALTVGGETGTVSQPQAGPTDTTGNNKNNAKIVGELIDKREASTKQFKMDDGTTMAVIYKNPVHYLKDGKWVDINNNLSDPATTVTKNSLISDSQIENETISDGYQNNDNSFNVKFAKEAQSPNLVDYHY